MNRFWIFSIAVMLCGFCAGGLSAADEPTLAAPALPPINTVKVQHIQLKTTEARIIFEIRIEDPAQPVVLKVDNANPIADVVSSIWPSPQVLGYRVVPKAGTAETPHTIELTIPKAANYEFSLTDKTWIGIKPQYAVIASDDNNQLKTKVHAHLMATVRGKFNYELNADTTVAFKERGVDRTIDVKALPFQVDGSTVHPDLIGISVSQNLAFWVDEGGFGNNNRAIATLQFPMLGNWPPSLTLPGSIGFENPDVNSLAPVPLADFATTIGKPTHDFDEKRQISRVIGPELGSDRFDSLPQVRFVNKHAYTIPQATRAFVRFGSKSIAVPGNYDQRATQSLTAPMGQENSKYLGQLNAVLSPLAKQDATLNSLHETLKAILPVLSKQEARIEVLSGKHMSLVQSGAAADVQAISRAKLESAKRAAAALVESYNALVLSYPD